MDLPPALDAAITTFIAHVYSYQPLVQKSVVLCPPIVTSTIQAVADAIGMDTETTAYTLGLFLAYPLGAVMGVLPNGKAKHLFSMFFGVLILQCVLSVRRGEEGLFTFLSSLLNPSLRNPRWP